MADAVVDAYGGGEETFYVLYSDDDGPLDLTGYLFFEQIWWDDELQLTFALDNGLTVLNYAPPVPPEGEEAEDHYKVKLTEAQTAMLPHGRQSYRRLIRISPLGVTMVAGPVYIRRIM